MRTAAATLVLGVVGALLAAVPAHAAPTITDFATCNAEAEDRTGSPSPSALPRDVQAMPDPATPARPRASAPAPTLPPGRTDESGTIITRPANPQLEGMSAARADDAGYRTAYQSCMRRRGF